MCGRYTQQLSWKELVELYRIHDEPRATPNLQPRYNLPVKHCTPYNVKSALGAMRNKTDRNDARGFGQAFGLA